MEKNSSVQPAIGNPSMFYVILSTGERVQGAVADLQHASGVSMSQALLVLQENTGHPIPTAFITGTATELNYAGLDSSSLGKGLLSFCSFSGDPLWQAFSSSGWPSIFSSQPNDAIVPLNSRLNGLEPGIGINVNSVVHSDGIVGFRKLGFTGPSVVRAPYTATQVTNLLNAHISDSIFVPTNP